MGRFRGYASWIAGDAEVKAQASWDAKQAEWDAAQPAAVCLRSLLRTRLNNIEYFPPNFEGLVLGCIDADFCK